MTGTMLFATVIDIAVVILLIIGFINEEKIIEIEDKLIYLAAKSLKKYLRRRSLKKKAAQKNHLHVVRAHESHANKIA